MGWPGPYGLDPLGDGAQLVVLDLAFPDLEDLPAESFERGLVALVVVSIALHPRQQPLVMRFDISAKKPPGATPGGSFGTIG